MPKFNAINGRLKGGSADVYSHWGGTGYGRPTRLLMPGARFDWEREAGNLWSNPVVALGLGWIGDRASRPQLKVGRMAPDGERVDDPRHGLVALWQRPNPFFTRRTLEKAILLSLKVDGNAYIYKRRDNAGRVCELWPIPHFRCRPTWPSDGSAFIDGYIVVVDGKPEGFPVQDVIHIRDGIDPINERFGLSPLKAIIREICTVNAEATYTAAILKNCGVPAVAIVPKEPMGAPPTEAQAERMKQRWSDEMTGDSAGGVVTFQGPFEVVKVGLSPEELAIDKLPQSAQARVASAIGPTAMSLGLPDPNKTYSNLSEANRASWNAIMAPQELVAESLCDDLVTEEIQVGGKVTKASGPLDLIVWYDYTQIPELQESQDAIMTRACMGYEKKLLTLNEGREMIGKEPVPDGDQFAADPAADPQDGQDEEDPAAEPSSKSILTNGHVERWRY